MPRCLVLRALGLGDLLAGVPALRALRRGLPDHEMVLAMPRSLAPLAQLAGVADRIIDRVDLGPVVWTGPPPDVAVDLHGNGPASKQPLLALQPGRLVAFAGPSHDGRWVPGPDWRDAEHEVHRWCRLVRTALGVPADPGDLLIDPPAGGVPAAGPAPVIVHPGAASGARRWPVERFAEVAAWASRFAPVAVTGSAQERALAEEVRRRASLPAESVLAGRTSPLELAGLVVGARLVVCGDTGVAHLATACRRPSVVLFGPTPPRLWGPPAGGPHVVLWKGDPDDTSKGDPHGATPDLRLLQITVPEVIEAVTRVWPSPSAGRPAPPLGPSRRSSGSAPPTGAWRGTSSDWHGRD
jgi:ADP-heptose:LPS heptosyltransferase